MTSAIQALKRGARASRPRISEPYSSFAKSWSESQKRTMAPEREEAVLQADLLPLLVGPPRVADWDLEDPRLALRELDRQLGLEPEVVRDDRDRLEEVGADGLVAGLHVREVHVGHEVREEREEPVAQLVAEEERAPGGAAGEARAEDRVRLVLHEDRDDPRDVLRVILEVRVVEDGDGGVGAREAGPDRRPLAAVPRVAEEEPVDLPLPAAPPLDGGRQVGGGPARRVGRGGRERDAALGREGGQHLGAAVLRRVVDDDRPGSAPGVGLASSTSRRASEVATRCCSL